MIEVDIDTLEGVEKQDRKQSPEMGSFIHNRSQGEAISKEVKQMARGPPDTAEKSQGSRSPRRSPQCRLEINRLVSFLFKSQFIYF